MTHDDAWQLLEPYLDGELGAEQRWAVTAHIASCPACSAYVADAARFRTTVRGRLRDVPQPPGLADRVRANVEHQTLPGSAPRRRLALIVPAVATLVVLLAGVWLVARATDNSDRQEVNLTGELATSHDLFAQDESLLEVEGDPAAVVGWFAGTVPFPVNAPEVPGYRLAGARLITVAGRPASMVVYEDESERRYVSLVTFDGPNAELGELAQSGSFLTGTSGQTAIALWSDGDLRHALVVTAPRDEALRLARAVSGKS